MVERVLDYFGKGFLRIREKSFASLFVILVLFLAGVVTANTTREITWDDLVPDQGDLVDPFIDLEIDQKVELGVIMRVESLLEHNMMDKNSQPVKDAAAYRLKLEAQGLDVDWYLHADEAFRKKIEAGRNLTVPTLNGATARIAGYALPLEYEDEAVTELLLVPYVGACIHVPAPPPNQMVYVKLKEPFRSVRLYTPVYVTGTLSTENTTKSIYLTDGQSDIQSGYAMSGARVELFTQSSN